MPAESSEQPSSRTPAPGASPETPEPAAPGGPRPGTPRPDPVYRDPNLLVIFGVTLAAVLAVSSITPAFPAIGRALDVSSRDIGLLISVFTVPGIVLTPLLGMLADRWGRKRILVPSLLLFGLAGSACALARDFQLLLAFRFLQGVGGAALGSLNLTIIGDLYTGTRRAAAMGYNSSVLSVGTASYPAIGGLLATFAWFYPFLLPLLALPVAFLVLRRLESPEPDGHQAMREYLKDVWRSVSDRRAIGLFTATAVTFMILFGAYLAYFPVLLDESFGASPATIGLVMSSVSLSAAISATQLGRASRLLSERVLVVAGYVAYVFVMAGIALAHSLWLILLPAVLFGLANGLAIPSIFSLVAGLAPHRHRGAFLSMNGMVLRLGETVGPVLAGVAVGAWGPASAFWGAAALSALTAVGAALAVR